MTFFDFDKKATSRVSDRHQSCHIRSYCTSISHAKQKQRDLSRVACPDVTGDRRPFSCSHCVILINECNHIIIIIIIIIIIAKHLRLSTNSLA